jgi:hypothetical protein
MPVTASFSRYNGRVVRAMHVDVTVEGGIDRIPLPNAAALTRWNAQFRHTRTEEGAPLPRSIWSIALFPGMEEFPLPLSTA